MGASAVKEEPAAACLLAPNGERRELTDREYRFVLHLLDTVGPTVEYDTGPRRLTTGEAAEVLGVSRRTVVRAIDAGRLPCERSAGGHRLVTLEAVVAYGAERARRSELLGSMRDL